MPRRTQGLGLRKIVEQRAQYRCEYCKAPQPVTGIRYHVEHVLPQSLGGSAELENLALACPTCNYFKANHILGIDEDGVKAEQLFDPRADRWDEHLYFNSETFELIGKTIKGRGTVNRLQMNMPIQIEARRYWVVLEQYP